MAEGNFDTSFDYTDSNIRYLKCISVVTRVFPTIMQRLMEHSSVTPEYLYKRIVMDVNFRKKITNEDHQLLLTLYTDGYKKLDMTLIFKIIAYYKMFISQPTRGWNSVPVQTEDTIGDDVQRLRLIRNHFLHKVEVELSEQEFDKFFTDTSMICDRIDKYLNCTESLKVFIEEMKTKPLIGTKELHKRYEEERVLKGQNVIQGHSLSVEQDLFLNMNKNYPEPQPQLPSAIYKMDDQSKAIYEEALKSGSEVKREIRVIIVGKKGAGKTTLTRRLVSKSLDDVTSTNGVDIHFVTLEDKTEFKKRWHEKHPTTANSRLLVGAFQTEKKLKEKLDERKTYETAIDNTLYNVSVEDNTTKETLSSRDTVTSEAQEPTTKRKDDSNSELADIIKAAVINENEIRISIWDFGGDEEFYYTHPVFLAEDAVYLIVTNLADSNDCSHGAFNFWFDTIHCYCNDIEGTMPRIVVVGTHKDQCEPENTAKNKMGDLLDTVDNTLRNHIYGEVHLISNTEYDEKGLKKVQAAIVSAAKECSDWENTHPLKFILLDKILEEKKQVEKQKPVVTFDYIKQINSILFNPLTSDELTIYLRYNHVTGHLIFFEDIPQYVILDPQWLSDMFRCIVAADEFQLKLPQLDWNELRKTGKITEDLLRAVFRHKQIEEHQEYLTEVMEKFHIIIKLPYTVGAIVNHSYFAPCMIRENKLPTLTALYKQGIRKSTCLCLVFDFLPPFVFNHIMMKFCEKYAVYSDYLPLFYTDAAIFTISSNGCSKLVLVKYQNIVQLQMLVLGAGHLKSCGDIKIFFEGITNEIIHTFGLQIKYKIQQKCQDTAFNCCDGLHSIGCQEEEYFCEEHSCQHSFRNDWIDLKQNPVHNGSTLSQKQLNFTRLALLVTEVVVDALHDLLPSPKVKTRNQSDMTSLYEEHRTLNQHKPSSNRWGRVKTVNDIPSTSISVGDDIERCRVIRNRLNHTSHYEMEDSEFQDLYKMIHEILTRLHNFLGSISKPTYMEKAEEIKRKTYQLPEMKKVERQLEKEPQVIKYYYTENNEVHHHYNYWCNLL